MKKSLKFLILLILIGALPVEMFAWDGMSTPMLHVEGRQLKNPSGQNVVLRGGWMQPTSSWFNGQGRWYSDPTDWTNPSNYSGMVNFMKDAATLMSDVSPRYGTNHGWYSTFVRVNTDDVGGWTHGEGLTNSAQFDAWIQNFVVSYANHLRSRGLYLVLCATGPISGDMRDTHQEWLKTFWSRIASAPGVKNADNIMFELLNEPVEIESVPYNEDWGFGESKYFEAFRDWLQPVIDEVRNTGANNVIWVPTLEWQGSPHQWVEYPFSGSNIGIAAHIYPAYGGCYDNASCHNDLWNRSYKPATDRWPMIITENFWFPEDDGGLCDGSTEIYGNTLKANIDRDGNVSYMIGFLGDVLDDLNNALPADCNLSWKQGAQAAFEWWYQYNGSCTPTTITPYIQVDGGSWQQTSSVTVDAGSTVKFGPQPVSGGSWSWTGCGTSGSSREQTFTANSSCTATATYTNSSGCISMQDFNVTVSGGTDYVKIQNRATGLYIDGMGRTSDGSNAGQWGSSSSSNQQWVMETSGSYVRFKNQATGLYLDGMGRTSDGSLVGQWSNSSSNNQQWTIEDLGSYKRIKNSASGLYIDGMGWSTNGSDLGQWSNSGSDAQQWTITNLKSTMAGSGGLSTVNEGTGNKINEDKIKIYPNPVSTGLTIVSAGFKYNKVEIIDVMGNTVLSRSTDSEPELYVPVNLANGVYIVMVSNEKEIIQLERIIINN